MFEHIAYIPVTAESVNSHQNLVARSENSVVSAFNIITICKFLIHIIFIIWGLTFSTHATQDKIESITLAENTHELTLFVNGTCSTINEDIIVLADENNQWDELASIQSIHSLSGLAILEQVKQQVRKTRVIVSLDRDNETRLTIKYRNKTQSISLYSVNLLQETYPKAQLLASFMEIVTKMRNSEVYCN